MTTQPMEQPAWDVFKATCPTRQVLDCITNKWAVLVLGLLIQGPLRFNEVRGRIEGVSQKMLTQTLRGLERDGLISRTIFPTVPPRVDYALTPLGRSLAGLVEDLRIWSEANIEDVLRSRVAFDDGREV